MSIYPDRNDNVDRSNEEFLNRIIFHDVVEASLMSRDAPLRFEGRRIKLIMQSEYLNPYHCSLTFGHLAMPLLPYCN